MWTQRLGGTKIVICIFLCVYVCKFNHGSSALSSSQKQGRLCGLGNVTVTLVWYHHRDTADCSFALLCWLSGKQNICCFPQNRKPWTNFPKLFWFGCLCEQILSYSFFSGVCVPSGRSPLPFLGATVSLAGVLGLCGKVLVVQGATEVASVRTCLGASPVSYRANASQLHNGPTTGQGQAHQRWW